MLLTGDEVVIDLTDEGEGEGMNSVIHRAKTEALSATTRELTVVYHLDAPFLVKELAEMLKLAPNLESFSMFSIAFNGTSEDFDEFAKILKAHKMLKEVHMIDCGMYGTWVSPSHSDSITSTSVEHSVSKGGSLGSGSARARDSVAKGGSLGSGSVRFPDSATNVTASVPTDSDGPVKKKMKMTATAEQSMMSISSTAPRTMDVLLEALASIQTLENVELYGIPSLNFDISKDADEESKHAPLPREGEGDQDIPIVPMGMKDSVTYSDDDYMDDYDEDIRGIPGNKRACGSKKNEKLSLMMSPSAIGALCRAPRLANLGMEDLNLRDSHIIKMMESLAMPCTTVKELKIWGCNITDKACTAIAQMLQVNKTLVRLDLANNHINDKGCILIATALHGNTALESLNLMGNECAQNYDAASVGGAYEAMMDLMAKNKTLTDLVLEAYEQDDEPDVPEFIYITVSESGVSANADLSNSDSDSSPPGPNDKAN